MKGNMRTKIKKLPDKLSALILLALDDLKKAERSKKYKIDMGGWHHPNSHCSVCFAGAVIAFSLGADPKKRIDPYDFDTDTRHKLLALNSARCGFFNQGAMYVGGNNNTQDKAYQFNTSIPDYHEDRKGFRSAMRKAALALKKAKL